MSKRLNGNDSKMSATADRRKGRARHVTRVHVTRVHVYMCSIKLYSGLKSFCTVVWFLTRYAGNSLVFVV